MLETQQLEYYILLVIFCFCFSYFDSSNIALFYSIPLLIIFFIVIFQLSFSFAPLYHPYIPIFIEPSHFSTLHFERNSGHSLLLYSFHISQTSHFTTVIMSLSWFWSIISSYLFIYLYRPPTKHLNTSKKKFQEFPLLYLYTPIK